MTEKQPIITNISDTRFERIEGMKLDELVDKVRQTAVERSPIIKKVTVYRDTYHYAIPFLPPSGILKESRDELIKSSAQDLSMAFLSHLKPDDYVGFLFGRNEDEEIFSKIPDNGEIHAQSAIFVAGHYKYDESVKLFLIYRELQHFSLILGAAPGTLDGSRVVFEGNIDDHGKIPIPNYGNLLVHDYTNKLWDRFHIEDDTPELISAANAIQRISDSRDELFTTPRYK